MNNKVNITPFIGTIKLRSFSLEVNGSEAMFLFSRSALAVCLALVVAGLPVLIQYL